MARMNTTDSKMTDKKALRTRHLALRRALSEEAWRTGSARILERAAALPEVADASAILVYVAVRDNEVNTQPFIRSALVAGREIWVPVTYPKGRMTWSRLEAFDELSPAAFGLLEPQGDALREGDPPPESVVLVPGLAFDRTGARIGFGGGYFDRFLAGFPGFKAGLAFDVQLTEGLPVEPHDVRMDAVVTETTTHRM